MWRWFCGDCGSPIAHDPDAAPEIIALKGGTLDSEIKKGLKPVCFYSFSLPLCFVYLVGFMLWGWGGGDGDDEGGDEKGVMGLWLWLLYWVGDGWLWTKRMAG